MLTRQAWRQELPCIDGLRQAVKDGAVPEEIGAHGHHNIRTGTSCCSAGKQQGHKGIRLIAVALLTIAKNLFELIHQQQEIGALWQGCRVIPPLNPAVHAARSCMQKRHGLRLLFETQGRGRKQRLCKPS